MGSIQQWIHDNKNLSLGVAPTSKHLAHPRRRVRKKKTVYKISFFFSFFSKWRKLFSLRFIWALKGKLFSCLFCSFVFFCSFYCNNSRLSKWWLHTRISPWEKSGTYKTFFVCIYIKEFVAFFKHVHRVRILISDLSHILICSCRLDWIILLLAWDICIMHHVRSRPDLSGV